MGNKQSIPKCTQCTLLEQILPRDAISGLSKPFAGNFLRRSNATILFADIVGFTELCSKCEPEQIASMLTYYFQRLDKYIGQYEVIKIETIGDCIMVISESESSDDILRFAMRIFDVVDEIRKMKRVRGMTEDYLTDFNVRVGLNSGEIMFGVINSDKPRYQVFGDPVNVAARMETSCETSHDKTTRHEYINMSEATWNICSLDLPVKKKAHDIKGKGQMTTYQFDVKDVGRQSHTDSMMIRTDRCLIIDDLDTAVQIKNVLEQNSKRHASVSALSFDSIQPGEYNTILVNIGDLKRDEMLQKFSNFRKSEIISPTNQRASIVAVTPMGASPGTYNELKKLDIKVFSKNSGEKGLQACVS